MIWMIDDISVDDLDGLDHLDDLDYPSNLGDSDYTADSFDLLHMI